MPSPRTWSVRFRSYLRRHKLTQLKFAIELGISPSVVSYWLRGSTPREETRVVIERMTGGEVTAGVSAKGRAA